MLLIKQTDIDKCDDYTDYFFNVVIGYVTYYLFYCTPENTLELNETTYEIT